MNQIKAKNMQQDKNEYHSNICTQFQLIGFDFWDNYLEQLTGKNKKHAYINNKQRCGVSAITIGYY